MMDRAPGSRANGYRVCAAITLAVFIASSLPYLYGYLRQDAGRTFTGIAFDVPDTAQYFAWMRAFARQPLIANPLTPEPGAARYFNLQWWLLGQLGYNTPLGPVLAYQGLRLAALAGFAVALVAFCAIVLRRGWVLAFGLAMLSSGFGWVLVIAKAWAPRLWYPLAAQIGEPNTIFSAVGFPHLLVAGGLMVAIFALFLRAADAHREGGWHPGRLAVIAGLTLALGFSHGYDMIPLLAFPAATVLVQLWQLRRLPPTFWPGVAIAVGAAPPVLYVLLLTRLDATWQGVLSQYGNAGVYTPPLPLLVVLLGLPLPLALWQLRPAAWRGLDTPALFVRLWCVVGFALLYIPTDYQIKMLTGYQVPLAVLAARTVRAWYGAAERRLAGRRLPLSPVALLVGAVLGCAILTNVYLVAWRMLDLERRQYPYYLATSDVRALEALDGVTSPGDVVLASPEVGVFVPVYSSARPFVAHWAQTPRSSVRDKRPGVFRDRRFPSSGSPDACVRHDVENSIERNVKRIARPCISPTLGDFGDYFPTGFSQLRQGGHRFAAGGPDTARAVAGRRCTVPALRARFVYIRGV